jgi:adenine-specific DNA-methyltransferase
LDSWQRELHADLAVIDALHTEMEKITPEHDAKLQDLRTQINSKLSSPINPGNRKVLIFTAFGVKVAEPLPTPEPALATIFDMGRLRLRNVAAELAGTGDADGALPPPGFRVLKIDSSNMKDVYYAPDQVTQADLFDHVDNIKPDRTAEDLLFQVLLDWGVDLGLPIAAETLAGRQVFFVDTDALAACFETGVDEPLVRAIAERKPLRVVFRDAGFSDDGMKINVEQIFRTLSPATEVKAI